MSKVPGIRDLALATGYSTATVSRALRDEPSVRKATREAIRQKAEALGYRLNPYVGTVMSSLRKGAQQGCHGNLAFLWSDFARPPRRGETQGAFYLRGALRRAEELGYHLEEYFIASYTPKALRNVLYHRGVRGILISPPSFLARKVHLRIALEEFAAVSLGWGLSKPTLDSVRYDHYQIVRMAIHHARRFERAGIAAIFDFDVNRRADHSFRAAFLANHPGGVARAEQSLFEMGHHAPEEILNGIARAKVVIFGDARFLTPALRNVVPPERRIYLFPPSAPGECWGWVDSQPELLGEWGIDQLVGKLQRHELGSAQFNRINLVPPRWRPDLGTH